MKSFILLLGGFIRKHENMRGNFFFLDALSSTSLMQLADADCIHAVCRRPTTWHQTQYICLQVCEHEWARLKGYFVSTLYWALLHYWYAIWLLAINKLLRNWKLLSRGLTALKLFGPGGWTNMPGMIVSDCWTPNCMSKLEELILELILFFSGFSKNLGQFSPHHVLCNNPAVYWVDCSGLGRARFPPWERREAGSRCLWLPGRAWDWSCAVLLEAQLQTTDSFISPLSHLSDKFICLTDFRAQTGELAGEIVINITDWFHLSEKASKVR